MTFPTLAAGGTATITMLAEVDPATSGGTELRSTVTISATTPDPDTTNNAASTSVIVAKPRAPTNVVVAPVAGSYGGVTELTLTLTSNGSPLSGQSVSFALMGMNIGSATTDASGVARLANVSLVGINAGTYANGVGASFAGEEAYAASSGTADLTVAKATPTIIWADPSGIVYGTALGDTQLNATTSVSGTLTYTPGAGTVLPAGTQTLSVTFTPADGTNYNGASITVQVTVAKAALTVTAEDTTKPYGAAVPNLAARYIGFVNGETEESLRATSALSGDPALSTSASVTSPVGTYAITVGVGTLSATNYSLTFANGTLTVTKGPLTVTADDKSRQYGDLPPTLTASYSGFVLGEGPSVLTGTLSCTTTATAASPAGSYPITCVGQTAANYALTYQPGTLTVAREDAALEYSGDTLKATASAGGTSSVKLAAVVREAADGSPGDQLAGTQLKFTVYKFTDAAMTSPVASCTAAVAATGSGTGSASCTATLGADNYLVKVELLANDYYVAPVETQAVTVVDPGTGFTTGGGWLAVADGARANFGFTVKYLKNGNIQGNSLYIYRKTVQANTVPMADGGFLPAGEYNWIIKSNAMGGLTQSCSTTTPKVCTATFSGKNTITAMDRATGVAYSLGGNYQFQVDVTDKGEPGSGSGADSYAIRVWSSEGGTYHQLGSPTAQVAIAGGNIQVRP